MPPSPKADDAGAVIDRLFGALARGDVPAARACCATDVRIWHSFDRVDQNLDQASEGWAQFISAMPERKFVDVRRERTPSGIVQQHLMVALRPNGERAAWPVCILVKLSGGLIARLDEYMDRAGSFPVLNDNLQTPGLPKI